MDIQALTDSLEPEYKTLFEHAALRVLNRLEQELSPDITFHNAAHTAYVMEKTAFLANGENIAGKQRLLLYLAAIYHDAGFLVSQVQHESCGCGIARRELNDDGLTKSDIDEICTTIMSTAIPQCPKSKSGEILADADLFYVVTDRYDHFAQKLYREMLHFHPKLTDDEWLSLQIGFLEKHHFHTQYAITALEDMKQYHLRRLKKAVENSGFRSSDCIMS